MKYEKIVSMQSFSFQKDIQFLSYTISDKTYIFRFSSKNTIKIQKFHFLDKICWKIICLNEVYKFSSRHFSTRCIFYVFILNIEKIAFFSSKYVRYEIGVVLQNRFLKVKYTIVFPD